MFQLMIFEYKVWKCKIGKQYPDNIEPGKQSRVFGKQCLSSQDR